MVVVECLDAAQARDDLAQAIMTAIRNHTGRQQYSPLEKAYVQLVSPARVRLQACIAMHVVYQALRLRSWAFKIT